MAQSALGKAPTILRLGPTPIQVARLFEECSESFESLDEFMLTLDLLYVLGKVDVDVRTKQVIYVNRD